MEYSEAISLLNDMKSRYHDGFSSSDKSVLEYLHREIFGREIKNKTCGDCYRDAYMLITLQLKKLKTMPKPTSNYTLKAGAMIRRPGDNRVYINPLPNDEIPEKFLADFPNEINRFASFPPDWKNRVELRKSGKLPEGEISQEDCRQTIAALREELSRKDEEIAALKAEKEEAENKASESSDSEQLANLQLVNGTLTAELASANEEIAALKAELAALNTTSEEEAEKTPAKTAKTGRKAKVESKEE